jgi:bifunctional polynucleotide phosphatase/kinase
MSITRPYPTLIRIDYNNQPNHVRIAMFDLDGTLIKTKSGRDFPVDQNDWEWKYSNVPDKIRMIAKDHRLYIITNQAGIALGKQREDDIINKIKAILSELNIPITVFVATAKDYWRKPNTSIAEHFILEKDPPEKIFYVGDAAGRPDDHSCVDILFAFNMYSLMKFLYPSLKPSQKTDFFNDVVYFTNQKSEPNNRTGFDPAMYLCSLPADLIVPPVLDSNKKYMILLIGPPGSGKSLLALKTYNKLVRVNRDSLGTMEGCFALTKQAIQNGKSVIIDNTNATRAERAKFIELATPDYEIKEIVLRTSRELAQHMDLVREKLSNFDLIKKGKNPVITRIPQVVYNKWYKNFEPPANPIFVDFIPKFTDKRALMYFLQRT